MKNRKGKQRKYMYGESLQTKPRIKDPRRRSRLLLTSMGIHKNAPNFLNKLMPNDFYFGTFLLL